MFTEVTVENAEEHEEAPDHDNHHHLLMRVQLIPDLTGLRFDWSELSAGEDPLCQVTNVLLMRLIDSENKIRAVDDPPHHCKL